MNRKNERCISKNFHFVKNEHNFTKENVGGTYTKRI